MTAQSERVVATPTQQVDLFWAVGGGGSSSTYNSVVPMKTRLFKEGSVGRAALAFNAASAGGSDSFGEAVGVFHSHLHRIVNDHGLFLAYVLANESLNVYTVPAPKSTADEVIRILAPITSALGELDLTPQTLSFVAASGTLTTNTTDLPWNLCLLLPPAGQLTSDGSFRGRIWQRIHQV